MKKTIALILALVIALSVFAVAPITTSAAEVDSAQTGGVDGMFAYTIRYYGGAILYAYYGNEAEITIPTFVDGHIVREISEQMFYSNSYVTEIVVPETVDTIGEQAFAGCYNLTDIYFYRNSYIYPDADTISSNATIHGKANSSAQKYAETYGRKFELIPDAEYTCGDYTYKILSDGTAEITGYKGTAAAISIPSKIDGYTVTSIGYSVFRHYNNLTSVVIPDTVTVINGDAFYYCTNITSIKLSDSLLYIGGGAFDGCKKLEQIDLPDTLVTIDDYALSDCDNLKSIEFPKSLKELGHGALDHCTSLTEVIIPDNVTTIEGSIFYGCSNLVSAVFPKSYTVIKYETFSGCTSLKEYVLEEHITGIESYAFERCTNLDKLYIYNPDCVFGDGNYDGRTVIDSNTTIYGWLNSTAHEYAIKYDRKFVPLDEEEPEIVRPEKVENFRCTETTYNSFTLEWDPVEGAVLYTVINMVNGYNYKTTTETSMVIPDRKVGTTYKYAVIAIFDDGTKMDVSKADVLELQVNAVVENIRVTDVGKFSATLTWDEIEGAEYVIYIDGTKYLRVKEPTAVVGLREANTQYYIRVIAFFPGRPDNEQFLLKDAKGVTVITDPKGEITSDTSLEITIPDEVKGADWNESKCAYNAWLMFGPDKNNIGSKYRFMEFDSNSYIVNNLDYDTEYYYYFRYFKDGKVCETPVTTVKTVNNETYDDIDITFTDEGKAVINWNVVNGATMYWVYVDGVKVSKQADNSAVTVDEYKDGATVTIKSQYEYKKGRFKMFDYEPTTIKK